MKLKNASRIKNVILSISIISYLSIILTGQMIGFPFFLWIILTIFNFGSIDQLFAIFGFLGIILNLTKWNTNIIVSILSFSLMLSPIVFRLVQVPIEMFNYLAFEIPLAIFIIMFLTYIVINAKEKCNSKQ
jgi:hypothetical protein